MSSWWGTGASTSSRNVSSGSHSAISAQPLRPANGLQPSARERVPTPNSVGATPLSAPINAAIPNPSATSGGPLANDLAIMRGMIDMLRTENKKHQEMLEKKIESAVCAIQSRPAPTASDSSIPISGNRSPAPDADSKQSHSPLSEKSLEQLRLTLSQDLRRVLLEMPKKDGNASPISAELHQLKEQLQLLQQAVKEMRNEEKLNGSTQAISSLSSPPELERKLSVLQGETQTLKKMLHDLNDSVTTLSRSQAVNSSKLPQAPCVSLSSIEEVLQRHLSAIPPSAPPSDLSLASLEAALKTHLTTRSVSSTPPDLTLADVEKLLSKHLSALSRPSDVSLASIEDVVKKQLEVSSNVTSSPETNASVLEVVLKRHLATLPPPSLGNDTLARLDEMFQRNLHAFSGTAPSLSCFEDVLKRHLSPLLSSAKEISLSSIDEVVKKHISALAFPPPPSAITEETLEDTIVRSVGGMLSRHKEEMKEMLSTALKNHQGDMDMTVGEKGEKDLADKMTEGMDQITKMVIKMSNTLMKAMADQKKEREEALASLSASLSSVIHDTVEEVGKRSQGTGDVQKLQEELAGKLESLREAVQSSNVKTGESDLQDSLQEHLKATQRAYMELLQAQKEDLESRLLSISSSLNSTVALHSEQVSSALASAITKQGEEVITSFTSALGEQKQELSQSFASALATAVNRQQEDKISAAANVNQEVDSSKLESLSLQLGALQKTALARQRATESLLNRLDNVETSLELSRTVSSNDLRELASEQTRVLNEISTLKTIIHKKIDGLGRSLRHLESASNSSNSTENLEDGDGKVAEASSKVQSVGRSASTQNFESLGSVLEVSSEPVEDIALRDILSPVDFTDYFSLKLYNCSAPTVHPWVLTEIRQWAERGDSSASPAPQFLFLSAGGGFGKTVIASKIIQELSHAVVGYHFIEHEDIANSSPGQIIRSLSYQLARRLPDYRDLLKGTNLDSVLENANVLDLFNAVLKTPLSALPRPTQPLIVVVDGLNEGLVNGQNMILKMLVALFRKLPTWLRFFVTARPHPDISTAIKKLNAAELQGSDSRTNADMAALVSELLTGVVDSRDLSAASLTVLQKCDGDVLYLNMFVRQWLIDVTKGNEMAKVTMKHISSFPSGVEGAFNAEFGRLFSGMHSKLWESARVLLSLMAAADAGGKYPIPEFVANDLIGWNEVTRSQILTLLYPFVQVRNGRYRLFHRRLLEWLTQPSRSMERFWVDVREGTAKLSEITTAKQNGRSSSMIGRKSMTSSASHFSYHAAKGS